MATIHWDVRNYFGDHLRPDGRGDLLLILTLHANIRMRCWPSMDLLIKETGWCSEVVTRAKQWLIEHQAIELVTYDLRVGKEKLLPPRQHVYQLTGYVEIDGELRPYIYQPAEMAPTDNTSLDETSPGEGEVNTNIQDITSPKIGDENQTPDRQRKNRPDPSQFTKYTPIKSGVIPQVEKSADEQPITELESLLVEYIKKVQPNTKTRRLRAGRKLLDQAVMYGGQTYPSPEDLWQQNPRFKAFVRQRMEWYERTNKPVINFINSIRDYGHPTFGWLVWSSTNAPAPVERKHNQYDDTYEQMMKEWKEEGERQSGDHPSS